MTDTQPMQADGAGTAPDAPDDNGEVTSRRGGKGESDGGAYPNPHSGKDGKVDGPDTSMGQGSQPGEAKTGDGPDAATRGE